MAAAFMTALTAMATRGLIMAGAAALMDITTIIMVVTPVTAMADPIITDITATVGLMRVCNREWGDFRPNVRRE